MSEQLESKDDEISLKEIIIHVKEWFNYLVTKWKLITSISIIASALGYWYAYNTKPVYKGTLTFVLEEGGNKGGGLGAYAGLASQFGINIGGGGSEGAFAGDNILELLKSRRIVEKALLSEVSGGDKKQSLIELFIDAHKLREKWVKSPTLSKIKFAINDDSEKFSLTQDSVMGGICDNIQKSALSIGRIDKKISIIQVTCLSNNETFSKYFVEQLTSAVTSFYIETKTKKAKENIQLLQLRTDSVRKALDGALIGSALLSDQNLNTVKQQASISKLKKQGEVQLLTALYTELLKNLEFSKFSLMQQTPLIQVIDKPVFPLDKIIFGKKKGAMIGGSIAGILTVLFLIVRKKFVEIMS